MLTVSTRFLLDFDCFYEVSIGFCCDSVVIFYLFLLCYFEKLEKTYVGVKHGQSIDTGNVRLKTQKEDKQNKNNKSNIIYSLYIYCNV